MDDAFDFTGIILPHQIENTQTTPTPFTPSPQMLQQLCDEFEFELERDWRRRVSRLQRVSRQENQTPK